MFFTSSVPRTRVPCYSLLFIVALLWAGSLQAQPQLFPAEPEGHVNDYADFLNADEESRLETKLRNYRDTTTTVLVVTTLESLQGHSIEEVGTSMFNEWNMWEGDRDNGALILVSREERRIRIEVGYGLEGAIPDIMAGRIIREILNPAFRGSRYYDGFDRATSAMIDLAAGEYEGTLASSDEEGSEGIDRSTIIFFLFLIYIVYVSSRRGGGKGNGKSRKRTLGPGGFIFLGGGGFGGHGGGGGGGGFGGFSGGGGFGSGGGGASGGW